MRKLLAILVLVAVSCAFVSSPAQAAEKTSVHATLKKVKHHKKHKKHHKHAVS